MKNRIRFIVAAMVMASLSQATVVTYNFNTDMGDSTSGADLTAGDISYAVGTNSDGAPDSSERAWDQTTASGEYLLNIGQRGVGNSGVADSNLTTTAAATLQFTLTPLGDDALDFSASTLTFDQSVYTDVSDVNFAYKIWADSGSGFVAVGVLQTMGLFTYSGGTESRLLQTDESTDLPYFYLTDGSIESQDNSFSFDLSSLGVLPANQAVTIAIAISATRNNQFNFGSGIDNITLNVAHTPRDMYLDLNGTTAGFGLDHANSPVAVDPTASTWNSDSSGGNGGSITALIDGDITHFMLSGTGNVRFDWTNYAGTVLGGIYTGVESGTPGIQRMQKKGGGGVAITWADGAVVDTTLANSFWWDLKTSGDFCKTGANDLAYMDGTVKQNGTVTIQEGNIHIEALGLVNANSSFILDGGGITIKPDLSGTMNIGSLGGSGTITRSTPVDDKNLWNTVIYINSGLSMSNNTIDSINVEYGSPITFGASAVSVLEINKSGSVLQADKLSMAWNNRPFALDGDLTVILLSGSDPLAPGDAFDMFDAGSNDILSGSFDSVTLPTLGTGLEWNTSALSTGGVIRVERTAGVQDMYLDLNGTNTGFGLEHANSPITVDPTTNTWNSDSSGGNGGYISSLEDGDIAHFMLSGTGGVLFNWINYAGTVLGGITTGVESGSPSINRMQKRGGGAETITWSAGAVVDSTLANGFWWDMTTSGDFTKTGSEWLVLGDSVAKIDGTCTISQGDVLVRLTGTVDADSSFNLNGGQLRFYDNIDDGGATVATIGTLSGSGEITRDGTASTLSDLTVNTSGACMTNGVATDHLMFAWGASATLVSGAVTAMDINKSGGTTQADKLDVDWASRTLTVDGTLTVTLLAGSEALDVGDSFDLFSDNISGTFTDVTLPTLPGVLHWERENLYINGTIVVSDAGGTVFKFR